MPIVTFHLVEGEHTADDVGELLRRACRFFADVIDSPIDRVRAFAQEYPAHRACVGGELVAEGAREAPFFQLYLLAGRPQEQRDRLLSGFTDLIVEVLDADRSRIRGAILLVAPEDWTIAGRSAAAVRAAEIAARANQA